MQNAGFLPVDGGQVYCETAGAGDPVVLTHDGIGHRETWVDQLDTFGRRHRVTRWDRRGYGRSAQPVAAYSGVDDLAAVIRSTSDAPAALVGCSSGAMVSLHCALRYPALVSALVLVGPVLRGLDPSDHFLARGGRGLPEADAPMAEQIEYWTGADPWYVAPGNAAARRRLRALLTANPQNLLPRSGLDQLPEPPPALARLGEVRVPTMVVVGEGDHPDVHACAGAIQVGIAGAQRTVLPGAGHLPHLEIPDAFNHVVLTFLDSRN